MYHSSGSNLGVRPSKDGAFPERETPGLGKYIGQNHGRNLEKPGGKLHVHCPTYDRVEGDLKWRASREPKLDLGRSGSTATRFGTFNGRTILTLTKLALVFAWTTQLSRRHLDRWNLKVDQRVVLSVISIDVLVTCAELN